MREEKHLEALKEVWQTLDEALKESSLLPHQRRLVTMLSLGLQHLIELYFHKLAIIKPGAQIKHNWFKAEEKRVKLQLQSVVTKTVSKIPRIDEVLTFSKELEKDRDELIYGGPVNNERLLKEKINTFLELKKIIEQETGDLEWKH